MNYDFGEFSVTSWGPNDNGDYQWRARWGEVTTEFIADRNTPTDRLRELGLAALKTKMSPADSG